MAIRFVLFDAVGTLIYPDPPVAVAYQSAGEKLGISLTTTEIQARFRAAYARVFRGASDLATDERRERDRWRTVVVEVFAQWPHLVDDLLERLWQHFAQPENWPLFADVVPTLSALQARGYELGVASNFDARLRQVIAHHPPLQACRHVFVSTELGHAKPSAAFFAAAQSQLRAQPQEIMLVGDDFENDVAAPRRCGWQAIELGREGAPPPGGIRSLTDLVATLP
jgi:putative hydrolase of the HAD superfamily